MEKRNRFLLLAAAIVVIFVATVAVLLRVIPEPHSKLDHLVIGAVATFLSMILLWVAMLQESKRPAPPIEPDAAPKTESTEPKAE